MHARSIIHEVQDLTTSTVLAPRRFGIGDIRIPVPAGRFTVIRSIAVSFNDMGAGFTWPRRRETLLRSRKLRSEQGFPKPMFEPCSMRTPIASSGSGSAIAE